MLIEVPRETISSVRIGSLPIGYMGHGGLHQDPSGLPTSLYLYYSVMYDGNGDVEPACHLSHLVE